MKRTFFTFMLSLCFIATVCGQKNEHIAGAQKFRNADRFVQRYDKFHDRTFVTVGPFHMSTGKGLLKTNGIYGMLAGFAYTGQKFTQAPDHFILGFSIQVDVLNDKRWPRLKDQDVIVFADGERFQLGKAALDYDTYHTDTAEFVSISVPADAFLKLGKARDVEIKVGPKVFKLNDEHLEAFRDLAILAAPAPTNS